MKKLIAAAVLAATLCTAPAFTAMHIQAAETDETEELVIPDVPMGQKYPDFEVTTTDGETFSLSDALEENQAVVINIFKTSCPACQAEIPFLNDMIAEYGDKAAFIGLDPCSEDTDESVAMTREEWNADIPMAVDEGCQAARFVPIDGYPCTVIVDKLGELVFYQDFGITAENSLENALEEVTSEEYEGGYRECNIFDLMMSQLMGEEGSDSGESAVESTAGKGEYHISVTDQNGSPVAGAMVNFCTSDRCRMDQTNENGEITIDVEPGTYHVEILTVPDGYKAEGTTEGMVDDQTFDISLTVTNEGA